MVSKVPKKIAIILDGNRRFAKKIGLQPWKGHEYGMKKLEELFGWCLELGIKELTLYSFSTENFNRAKNEIDLAKYVEDGYSRIFQLPTLVNGKEYNIKILSNRELVVNYFDKEHILFLPEKICGDIYIPTNEIDKENGVVCINSNLDSIQCKNAEDLGLCDTLDTEFLPGTKCCCSSRYGYCSS